MARDALEHYVDPETGEVVFTNLPRRQDGSVDGDRIGGEPYHDPKFGLVDPQPSVPGPDGRPVRPYHDEED